MPSPLGDTATNRAAPASEASESGAARRGGTGRRGEERRRGEEERNERIKMFQYPGILCNPLRSSGSKICDFALFIRERSEIKSRRSAIFDHALAARRAILRKLTAAWIYPRGARNRAEPFRARSRMSTVAVSNSLTARCVLLPAR